VSQPFYTTETFRPPPAPNGSRNYGGARNPPWSPIKASPFVWIDPTTIPRRQWLYNRHYIRKFVSETVAPGAYGKSTLAIAEGLAIVTGRPLLGVTPNGRANVWYWNGEDPMEELQRRIVAAARRYMIDPSEIQGRLFVDTGVKQKSSSPSRRGPARSSPARSWTR
jgi:hypothetical protein